MNVDFLSRRIDALEQRITNTVFGVIEMATLARTTADGTGDQANVAGNPSDAQRPVQRMSTWGLTGYPPSGLLHAIAKIAGGSFSGMVLGLLTAKYGPQNLNEGETQLWCSKSGTRVYLDKDGKIHIDSATGQDVIFNGGSLQVARKTDKTIADTTMAAWVTAVSAKFNAAAGPMLSAPGTITVPTDFGVINGGAANVKA